MKVLGTFFYGDVGKVPKNRKMKVIGTFPMYVGKVPKNRKMKVLGTFSMGTLQKYLKIKNESFRYFSNGYVGNVPKNDKMKVLGTFSIGTLEKYLKIKWVRWKST